MDTQPSRSPAEIPEFERDDSAWKDSSWGEGSASALDTLKKVEEWRAKSKPSEERPSGD